MCNEDWIKMAVELGLDGTEIYEPFVEDLDASGMARLADVVHDAGLQVSQYAIESHLCNPEQQVQEIAHVKRAVDAAVIFRTNIVRVVSGRGSKGLNPEDVLQSVADGLRGCLDYAEEKQVMLAFEDHFSVGTKIDDFMKILELVNDERLKVSLDTANATNGTAVDLAKLVAPRVVHTHVSDRKGDDHFIVVGQGDMDFEGVFRELKKAGYDGWLSLEVFVGGKENLQFSIEQIRNAWNRA
jgi:sugar phosphate isomerase/epimerase